MLRSRLIWDQSYIAVTGLLLERDYCYKEDSNTEDPYGEPPLHFCLNIQLNLLLLLVLVQLLLLIQLPV